MKNLHVAVLMGGTSTEREVSLRSGSAVARALTATGAHVTSVDVRGPNFNLPASVDVAFIALHGAFGEDGQMQRLLESRGVPYTGSDVGASARAFDKIAAKQAFTAAKVRTPRYTVIEKSRPDTSVLRKWKLPLVVKPARQGSSVGVSIVRKREELADALAQAWQHDEQVIVEDFIAGRELTVGIFDGKALPVVEVCPRKGFFTYEAKYTPGETEYLVPAPMNRLVAARAQHLAVRAHECLGCRDYSRVDIMLSTHGRGEMFVLEVNTIPGFTDTSLVPKAAKAAGMTFSALCTRLVEMALAHGTNGHADAALSAAEDCPVAQFFRDRSRYGERVALQR